MSGRFVTTLLCLLLTVPVRAEVFTWTDPAGVRHYGDRPPADIPAEPLALDQQPLSTIGDSGIRPGERELLEHAEAMEAARLQAAATRAAARAAAAQTPPRPELAPSPRTERRVVRYRYSPLPYWAYHRQKKIHWGFDLNLGRLSIHGGRLDVTPPHRPGYRPPHAHRPYAPRRIGRPTRDRNPPPALAAPALLRPPAP